MNFGGWNLQTSQPQQQSAPLRSVQKVEGELGIKTYPLLPGESVLAIDTTEQDIMWMKVCDASGLPTIQKIRYTLEENVSNTDYVSKKDFEELSKKLDKLLEERNVKSESVVATPKQDNTAANNNPKSSNFNGRPKNASS